MIKLTFIGDIMCKKQMLSTYQKKGKYNFTEVFENMKEYFQKSDIVIGNLETPISKDLKNLTIEKYNFSTPIEFAKAVYDSGITCVSTANNHCLDRGVEGLKETIKCLDEIGMLHVGTYIDKEKEPLILNINNVKIGVLSYTYGTNAFSNQCYLSKKQAHHVNLFQNQELSNPITRYCYHHRNIFTRIYNKIAKILFRKFRKKVYERKEGNFFCRKRLVRELRQMKNQNPDIIVMMMHTGGQYNKEATKETKKLTSFLLKQGINIVVGSHEHVVHGGDFSNYIDNQLVTYSLGNFCGVAGVYEEPFDTLSNYSIAWNVYIDQANNETQIKKITFSVLTTVGTDNHGIHTSLLYDLINMESDIQKKKKLIDDMKEIAYRFSNIKYDTIELEYEIRVR